MTLPDAKPDDATGPYPDTNAAMTAAQRFSASDAAIDALLPIGERLFRSCATGLRAAIALTKGMPSVNPCARLLVLQLAARFLLAGQKHGLPPPPELLEGLASLLNFPNVKVRTRAVKILIALGPQAAPIQGAALGCLRHADPQIRMNGALLLQALGPACDRGNGRQMKTAIERFPRDVEFCRVLGKCMNALSATRG